MLVLIQTELSSNQPLPLYQPLPLPQLKSLPDLPSEQQSLHRIADKLQRSPLQTPPSI